ncbi:MAG: N-6 DNA methylase [Prevotellaceae bacterium]|jgi:predicted helicase|nr:N-6 DNA methylase [Prevotellaceae bacterium]
MTTNENITQYIAEINRIYKAGNATEHSYRPALKSLLEKITIGLMVINEPKRIACGAPDYIVTRKEIPIGYIEAKDIDTDLNSKTNKAQFDRYKQSLDNLIITDYLTFQLFDRGEFVTSVTIAKTGKNGVVADKTQFEAFVALIVSFAGYEVLGIQTSVQLSKIMAAKARLMAGVIEEVLSTGSEEGTLSEQMAAFKEVLLHDIMPKEFADVYAQTITYGMFAACLHNDTPNTFSREKAAKLIPKTNPFLRQLFQNIAGFDLDERINWIVDDLVEAFRATDIGAVMKEFGKHSRKNDPMIHFYEDFLSAYDPALRKSRGVWYTPQAVVNFIVRAVDEILQTDFGLPMGLADTSKTKAKVANQKNKKQEADFYEVDVHKVQILDPATGTGTFLAEAVNQIYEKFMGQPGLWQSYVEEHLLPRLNGFELLMASYAMAHLKLDWLLTETGYKSVNNQRLRVYLTNSLEEYYKETGSLFSQFLAREANGASLIKRDTPGMVVMGNPPYSGESQNGGKWMDTLMNDYKKEPSGIKLQERNSKWINDDYVKFIRLGQHFIDKNGEGILAFINNHSFLDNPTFRGMRYSLLKSFDKIYILDLHGNTKKKETAPDGGKDENVFDIQQGVSINIFVKTGKKKKNELGKLFHCDLYGKREEKYSFLLNSNLQSVEWQKLELTAPQYFFIAKNLSLQEEYNKGFSVQELFPVNSVGVGTYDDTNLVSFSPFLSDNYLYTYRPFDTRFVNYDLKKVKRARYSIMRNLLNGNNFGLIIGRQGQVVGNMLWNLVFVSSQMVDLNIYYRGGGNVFPLYLYPADTQTSTDKVVRRPNLKPEIVKAISKKIGLQFEPEKSKDKGKFSSVDLLDYIYAILHSPSYREKYKEFLKIDFPRVPYPANADEFRRLSALGCELRRLHLMEHPALTGMSATYLFLGNGNNTVEHLRWAPNADGQTGRVCINDTQYFDNVPLVAWNFYIGGYQPAQKWLKDRKGRTLNFEDVQHYQRIIRVLSETGKIMREVDNCLG